MSASTKTNRSKKRIHLLRGLCENLVVALLRASMLKSARPYGFGRTLAEISYEVAVAGLQPCTPSFGYTERPRNQRYFQKEMSSTFIQWIQ
jgi:hypothetical protein